MTRRHQLRADDRASIVGRLEELVRAGSGEDPFEEVFKLVLARLHDERHPAARPLFCPGATAEDTRALVDALLRAADRRWPEVLPEPRSRLSPGHLDACVRALAPFRLDGGGLEVLDGLFERLVSTSWKGQKGQFFTPRHVVEACIRVVEPGPGERVVDPACGSGGFLFHARRRGAAVTGLEFDPRAARVARALLLVAGEPRPDIRCGDSLRGSADLDGSFDVVLSNPPFAGELREPALLGAYEVAAGHRRIERDALFVERCVRLLRPGGRFAIVLPHNKVGGRRWGGLRRWLLRHARVDCVLGLPRDTFQPHTGQKTVVVFGARRARPLDVPGGEPVRFLVSERPGKDRRGGLVLRPGADPDGSAWERLDHDLETLVDAARSGAGAPVVPAEPALPLAPERHDPRRSLGEGVRLGDLAALATDTVRPGAPGRFLVLDTRHAVEGCVQIRKPPMSGDELGSTKRLVRPGDLLVSRLRPYLRQVAWVDPEVVPDGATLACSTEFYVLRPRGGDSLAFLVPLLLGDAVQAALAAAQEGGHHPRVPRDALLELRVPHAALASRAEGSRAVLAAIDAIRNGLGAMAALVDGRADGD